MRGFITLPLFHAHGISSVFRAFACRKSIYMYSARLPLTRNNLLAIMQKQNFEIFYGVPYALKLLGESAEGIACLAKMQVVMFGGSACPDTLGDRLVEAGINLVSHYGTTETGQLMTSFRDRSDKAWNYVRPSAELKPFLRWDLQGGDIYELVVLDGWKSKVTSNRPDGSYATKDLFTSHPTIPNAWKYFARLDDTIVLLNGEKTVPTDTEQAVRDNALVQEAIIVGDQRPQLGMMVISSQDIPDGEIMKQIWPAIEKANKVSPAYAQLSAEMVHILPAGTEYPRTDKGTIIRQAFYKKFEAKIESLYSSADEASMASTPAASDAEIRALLITNILEIMGPATPLDDSSDFFSLGMDSLQALRLRKILLKSLPIKESSLGMNIAFDFPTINALAAELLLLQKGEASQSIPIEEQMQAVIEKYGIFPAHVPRENTNEGQYLVVTGATGSLGAHTIAQLAILPHVKLIHCLVRAKSASSARTRVIASLRERQIYHQLPLSARQKIVALPSDFSREDLGLGWEMYDNIARNIIALIHCAWSVNFNLKLSSFEKDCISGARHLMLLCLSARRLRPATFSFCSSVSAVAATPGGFVSEAVPASLSHAQNMGYAQSKLVTEHLIQRAADQTGMTARTLRVGQIVADTEHGVWNATEAIPLMLQAAETFGAIPALDESPLWLPVDVVAKAVAEISLSAAGAGVMNVVASQPFHWTRDLLPKLHAAGLQFQEPTQREWIRKLRASNPDPSQNPPIKLVNFFGSKYDNDNTIRKGLQYDTRLARSFSPSLAAAKVLDQDLVTKFVAQFRASSWAIGRVAAKPKIIVVAGPCGSGKTTVATALAHQIPCPYIEGDAYHDEAALTKMTSNIPLSDDDRWAWLERLRTVSSVSAVNAPGGLVVLTCSALKKEHRDILRGSRDLGAEVLFVLLQVSSENSLSERLAQRAGHYMKQTMVQGQVRALEPPSVREVDILPVDALRKPEDVLAEVLELVRLEL
ncbi:Adenylate-forming reductase [Lachnellula willkommii]|uniref:gluconokinase n=1 Tax=Lachnellula willkommii TaxID=215461 RepID=A0A559MFG9_9HELO|nr:Adenylate-forming reductase [Lachnellula willkommii]